MRQEHQDRTVARSGQLVLGGQAADAIELLGTLPETGRDRPFWLLLGDAHRANGDVAAARMAYHEVRPREDPAGFLDTGVAWRRGMINQQQGEPRLALEIYHRASTTEGDLIDRAWLLAGMATARRHGGGGRSRPRRQGAGSSHRRPPHAGGRARRPRAVGEPRR